MEASSTRPKQGLNTSLKDPWESKSLKRDKSWWQREWDLCKFFIRWTPYIDESLVCPGLSFCVCGGGRGGSIYTARYSDEEMETVKLTYLHVVEPAWYLVYELCIQQSRGELYNGHAYQIEEEGWWVTCSDHDIYASERLSRDLDNMYSYLRIPSYQNHCGLWL